MTCEKLDMKESLKRSMPSRSERPVGDSDSDVANAKPSGIQRTRPDLGMSNWGVRAGQMGQEHVMRSVLLNRCLY